MATFLKFLVTGLIIAGSLPLAHAETKELRIAALLPLTGPLAKTGTEIKKGMELGLESVKESPIEKKLIFEDTQYDLRQAATAVNKVINQDKADVVISLWDQADVIAPITERAGILHIAIRWDPSVTKGRPLTFTLESTYISYVQDFLKLANDLGIHSISLIGEESASGDQLFSELERQAPSKGVNVLGRDTFTSSSADFRSILARSISLKPDLVFIYAFPPNIDLLIRQLKQLAPNQRFSGLLELVEDLSLVEGVTAIAPFGASEEFNSLYKKRFGENFKIRAPHGYEVIRLVDGIFRAIWKESKPSSQEAADFLSQIKDIPSSLGPLTASQNRNIEHPTARRIAINGSWHDLKGYPVQ